MRRWNRQLLLVLALLLSVPGVAVADWQQSTNYGMNESEIGGNGCANQIAGCGTSAGYSLDSNVDDGGSSLGEFAVGNSSSASYQTGSGFNTTAQPGLGLTVNTSSIDLGVLSTGVASTATASFSVSDYTSSGYVVQVIGATPINAGHNLTAMTGNAGLGGDASQNGVEQFGLNLVHNTSPANPVPGSADPVCQVSGFCYGVAGDGSTLKYTVDGRYRYVSGETVASGPRSSGVTNYVVTFLANQAPTTFAGKYSGSLSIVATGTF